MKNFREQLIIAIIIFFIKTYNIKYIKERREFRKYAQYYNI